MKITTTFLIVIVLSIFIIATAKAQTKTDSVKTTVQDSTRKAQNLKLLLDQIEIRGWIERPQIVYVVPGINPKIDDIILERSFIYEILRPLEKNKFEKQKIKKRRRTVIPW